MLSILYRQQGVATARVDIDQDRELALQYGVTTFPRVLFWNRYTSVLPSMFSPSGTSPTAPVVIGTKMGWRWAT